MSSDNPATPPKGRTGFIENTIKNEASSSSSTSSSSVPTLPSIKIPSNDMTDTVKSSPVITSPTPKKKKELTTAQKIKAAALIQAKLVCI